MSRSELVGFALGCIAAFFWSLHIPAAFILTDSQTSPLVFYFYVLLWAALISLPIHMLTENEKPLSSFQQSESLFLVLILTGGYGIWLFLALATNAAEEISPVLLMAFYTSPMIAMLLGLFTKESPNRRQITMSIVGFIGCGIVFFGIMPEGYRSGFPSLKTVMFLLGAAICWALFSQTARHMTSQRKTAPMVTALWITGAVCLFVTCLSHGESILNITRRSLLISVVLGVFTLAAGFGIWLKCLKYLPLPFAVLIWYLAPVFSILWIRWFAHGTTRWWVIPGIMAILLTAVSGGSKKPETQKTFGDIITKG